MILSQKQNQLPSHVINDLANIHCQNTKQLKRLVIIDTYMLGFIILIAVNFDSCEKENNQESNMNLDDTDGAKVHYELVL